MALRKRDPRTKEELLDRMLSFDFDGDIRNLGAEPASISRQSPHVLLLTFPASNTVFELSIHRPREFAKAAAVRAEPRSFTSEDDEPAIVADDATASGGQPQRRRQPAQHRVSGEGSERRQAQG